MGLGGLSFSMGTPSWQLMMEAVVMVFSESNGKYKNWVPIEDSSMFVLNSASIFNERVSDGISIIHEQEQE